MAKESVSIKNRDKTNLSEPGKYAVIFHNDDFTTMDFVVMVLVDIFHLSQPEADTVMLKVHHEGKAIVGIYSYDIAQTKSRRAISCARENHYPLRVTVEKANG